MSGLTGCSSSAVLHIIQCQRSSRSIPHFMPYGVSDTLHWCQYGWRKIIALTETFSWNICKDKTWFLFFLLLFSSSSEQEILFILFLSAAVNALWPLTPHLKGSHILLCVTNLSESDVTIDFTAHLSVRPWLNVEVRVRHHLHLRRVHPLKSATSLQSSPGVGCWTWAAERVISAFWQNMSFASVCGIFVSLCSHFHYITVVLLGMLVFLSRVQWNK